MRSLRYGVVALAALGLMLFLSAARAAEVPALPQEIKPDNPGIRLIGRFDTRDAAGPAPPGPTAPSKSISAAGRRFRRFRKSGIYEDLGKRSRQGSNL